MTCALWTRFCLQGRKLMQHETRPNVWDASNQSQPSFFSAFSSQLLNLDSLDDSQPGWIDAATRYLILSHQFHPFPPNSLT